MITISLKKRTSFDELVKENRQKILNDQDLLERIEESIEMKRYQSLKKTNENDM